MLPLALVMKARGYDVCGSDRAYDQGRVPERFAFVEAQGIKMCPQNGSGITEDIGKVIVSAAVEETVPDYKAAKAKNIPIITRAELLSDIFNQTEQRIGIAGTSGKSTVTGMVGWMMSCAAEVYDTKQPTIINGATMKNFVTEELPFASSCVGEADQIVAEVDESDGSIAQYDPTIAVINNIAHDHKSMEELRTLFSGFAGKAQKAVLNLDNEETAKLAETIDENKRITFSLMRADADLLAINLSFEPDRTEFDLVHRATSKTYRVSLAVPGHHNIANALAALGVAIAADIDIELAIDAVGCFTGIARRYDVIGHKNFMTVIDDFAHNPDKIAATLRTLHQTTGRVQILFQPHGYGPLALLREELTKSFADGMKENDTLTLCDPLYLGGTTERKVTSADLVADIVALGKTATHTPDRETAAMAIVNTAERGDKIIVMGARDDSLTTLAQFILKRLPSR